MQLPRHLLLGLALLTVTLFAPAANAQQGRWNQAFRNTGSQAMKRPGQPLINNNPVYSPFDLSGQTSDLGWYSYPGYPLLHQPAPWPACTMPGTVIYPIHPHPWFAPAPSFQSYSVQNFNIHITPPPIVSNLQPPAENSAPLPLQAATIPLAFDPADPQMLNFAAPARTPAAKKPLQPQPGLPGVAAQPVTAEADQAIVLRGKRKLADGRKR